MPDRAPPPPAPSLTQALVHGPFVRPPRTRVGWGSIALAAAYLVAAGVHRIVFARVADDAAWRPAFMVSAEAVLVALGVATGAAAAIAVWRRGERSWLLGVPLTIGLGAVVFLLGTIFGPA